MKKRKIDDRLWQLEDGLGYICHLLIGDRKALLIDSMCGMGDIESELARLTALPVTVALTHAHFDHIGGAYFFKEALLPEAEQAYIDEEEGHLRMVERKLAGDGAAFGRWCLRNGARPRFLPVSEGDTIDLGGLTVAAVALPGHTAGSVGYICPEKSLLFSGDAFTPIMCLFFHNSLSVAEYRATLHKTEKLPFTRFLTSHHKRMFDKAELEDFDACAAFAETDIGMYFQHDIIEGFRGRLHIYRGDSSEDDDFLALISKYTKRQRNV